MDRLIIKTLAMTLTLVFSTFAIAQKAQLNFETAYELYFLQDCGSGDARPDLYQAVLLAKPERATPLLAQALIKGPGAKIRKTFVDQVERDYKNLSAYMEKDGLSRIENKDVLKAARSISRDQYLNMRKKDFEIAYRERAFQALTKLNTKQSRQAISDFIKMKNQDENLIKAATEWLAK